MKLTLLLLLVFASVALLRAEEETVEDVEEQEQPSMNDLLDGSLDDEVLGNEEDPGHFRRRKLLRRLGDKVTQRLGIHLFSSGLFSCFCYIVVFVIRFAVQKSSLSALKRPKLDANLFQFAESTIMPVVASSKLPGGVLDS